MSGLGFGYTTNPTTTTCPRCRALILAGWSEGLGARVDPVAITQPGELAAILAKRPTYTLTCDGLIQRTSWRTEYPRGPVLAAHSCKLPIPHEYYAPIPARHIVEQQISEGIPF